jgi:hypothetical protein
MKVHGKRYQNGSTGVTVICVSQCLVYHHGHITRDMGIPCNNPNPTLVIRVCTLLKFKFNPIWVNLIFYIGPGHPG